MQRAAIGRVQRQPEVPVVAVGGRERPHGVRVGERVRLDQLGDALVRERLAEPEQRQRRRHPLQVPRVVPEVGLVEVVDVEDEHALGVHVGAVVLGVQVALDPHARGRVVDPRVVEPAHVGVEQRRAAAVEGERRPRPSCGTCPGRRAGRARSVRRRRRRAHRRCAPGARSPSLRGRRSLAWPHPATRTALPCRRRVTRNGRDDVAAALLRILPLAPIREVKQSVRTPSVSVRIRLASHRQTANRTYVRYAAASSRSASGSRSYWVLGTRL